MFITMMTTQNSQIALMLEIGCDSIMDSLTRAVCHVLILGPRSAIRIFRSGVTQPVVNCMHPRKGLLGCRRG